MPAILKPDTKSLVWAGIGFLVVPKLLNLARR
jgi:hypothetical protein